MALSQSELIRLPEPLRPTDGIEFVRTNAERMVQELIEAEAKDQIGAEWNERTPTRTNVRNGHRERMLTTLAGDLDLEIPKVRTGSFFPSLLERRRRIDHAHRSAEASSGVRVVLGDAVCAGGGLVVPMCQWCS